MLPAVPVTIHRPTLFILLFCGVFSLVGCQSWKGRSSGGETKVDTALASPVPARAPQVIPDEPQKGFEQETQKAQTV